MIKQILALLSFIGTIFTLGYVKGKKTHIQEENEETTKQVKARNSIIDSTHALGDADLDKLVQKFTKTE